MLSDRDLRHLTILQRFLQVVDARGDERLSLVEVSKSIGTSPRMLTLIITEFLGVNPQRFILEHRLRLARAALLGGATVTRAAANSGFYQPGRFAKYYRQLFGELPLVTKLRVHPPSGKRRHRRRIASASKPTSEE